jgi:hypothetical protein
MANTLSFALGLESSGFLSSLGSASVGLDSFLNVVNRLGSVFRTVWSQVEKGAALDELSKRTSQSVEDLFKLQRGFQLAGVEAGSVPTVLYQMQKALGGISETGEPTAKIFSAMGLSIEALKAKGGAAALESILSALNGLSVSDASFAASKIFGRGGAQDMLQLARSMDDFSKGMAASASSAKEMASHAAAFDKLKDTLEMLRWRLADLFIGPAGFIADIANAIPKAIDAGRLSELLELALTVGFEAAVDQLWMMLQRVAAALPGMIKAGFTGVLAAGGAAAAAGTDVLASVAGLASEAGVMPKLSTGMAEALARTSGDIRTVASQVGQDAIAQFVAGIKEGATTGVSPLFANSENRKRLEDLIALFAGPEGGPRARPGEMGLGLMATAGGKLKPTEANALEKIGAVFGSGAGPGDYMRDVAKNTGETTQILKDIREHGRRRADWQADFGNLN